MKAPISVFYALIFGLSLGWLSPLIVVWIYARVLNAELTAVITMLALYSGYKLYRELFTQNKESEDGR